MVIVLNQGLHLRVEAQKEFELNDTADYFVGQLVLFEVFDQERVAGS